MDRYQDDLFEQIRRLTARIETLEAQLHQRPGATRASQGWLLADMGLPTVPAGFTQIGSAGGEFYAKNSAGTVKRLFNQTASVSSIGDSDAGPAYDATARTLINSTKATVNLLLANERTSGQLAL